MCADERVMEWLAPALGRERAVADATRLRTRLERDGYGWWVVEVRGGAPFAGLLMLQMVPFDAAFTPAMEVGWRLAYDAWGRGYATEGARALLDFAFERLERGEIVAMTARANLRSQRVMERLGMHRDPSDDFDNPRLAQTHPLRPHVLYRIERAEAVRS